MRWRRVRRSGRRSQTWRRPLQRRTKIRYETKQNKENVESDLIPIKQTKIAAHRRIIQIQETVSQIGNETDSESNKQHRSNREKQRIQTAVYCRTALLARGRRQELRRVRVDLVAVKHERVDRHAFADAEVGRFEPRAGGRVAQALLVEELARPETCARAEKEGVESQTERGCRGTSQRDRMRNKRMHEH
jgi:hypothetical protein